MTNKEAIKELRNIARFNYTLAPPEVFTMAIEALKDQRPQGKWEYLKEHITEMRDADGKANQTETCQFILNLMGVIEREGDRNEQTTD